MNDLTKMSDAELETYNNELGRAREAIRADQLKIRDELDRRAAVKAAQRLVGSLSPAGAEALRKELDAKK